MTVETIGALGYGIAAGGLFVADATGVIPDLGNFDIGQISSIGFAIWYGWYVTCRAIPKIIEQNATSFATAEDKHSAQMKDLTETFRADTAAARAAREIDREHFTCEGKRQAEKR